MSSRAELPERLRPGTRVPTNPILSMSVCLPHPPPPLIAQHGLTFCLASLQKSHPACQHANKPTRRRATLIQDVSLGLSCCIFSSLIHAATLEPLAFHEGDGLTEWLASSNILSRSLPVSLVWFPNIQTNRMKIVSVYKLVLTSALPLLACSPNHTVS